MSTPDPTNECSEAADYLSAIAKSDHCRHASERLAAVAALLRKVGPLVEVAKRIERGCRYDDRCGNCQAVIDLQQALAAFSPEPNREHDAAAERTRVAES